MKVKMKIFALLMCMIFFAAGCTEADKVNANISQQADYFECEEDHSLQCQDRYDYFGSRRIYVNFKRQ